MTPNTELRQRPSRNRLIAWWVGAAATFGLLFPAALWRTMGRRITLRSGSALAVAGVILLVLTVGSLGSSTTEESEKAEASTSNAGASAEPRADATDTERAASSKTAAPSKSPHKEAISPPDAMATDVRKNLKDEVGKRAGKVSCQSATTCSVTYELGSLWKGKDDELARDAGGVLHELFRDTKVASIDLHATTTTVDALGNEKPHDEVLTIIMSRTGWKSANWDNLKYSDPAQGLRLIADDYIQTIHAS